MKVRVALSGHSMRLDGVAKLVSCRCGWSSPARTKIVGRDIYRQQHVAPLRAAARRVCRECGEDDPKKMLARPDTTICRRCERKRMRAWIAEHPEQHARAKLDHHFRKKYGITVDDYERMVEAQAGRCRICNTAPSGAERCGRLHVDHDHATGRVRGLLCYQCNSGLGSFRDDPTLLESAIRYLEPPKDAIR